MNSLILSAKSIAGCLAAILLSFASSSKAINIAREGIPLVGLNDAIDSDAGTYKGSSGEFTDGNIYTYGHSCCESFGMQIFSYAAVIWDEHRVDRVSRLTLTFATLEYAGWFGPPLLNPAEDGVLLPSHLIEPTIQVSRDRGITWDTVSHTSDYIESLTGHVVGGPDRTPTTAATSVFELGTPQEGINGVRVIGKNGGIAKHIALFEFEVHSIPPSEADTDGDHMDDAWEIAKGLEVGVDDSGDDLDGDGLTNLKEYEVRSDPRKVDSDKDGLSDLIEVEIRSNPIDAKSPDLNIARKGVGFAGTKDAIDGENGTPVYYHGNYWRINDGSESDGVKTYSDSTDTVSYAGVQWNTPVLLPVTKVELILGVVTGGGWFGKNSRSPGEGGYLDENYLIEPTVQVTNDGATWTNVPATSNYLTAFEEYSLSEHRPGYVTSTFVLGTPQAGITGIRLIGLEGGTETRGYVYIAEFVVRDRRTFNDNDKDGLSNEQETNILRTNHNDADSDDDGLSDGQEHIFFDTDPLNPDSDGDGFPDGMEVSKGFDPLNLSDFPKNVGLIAQGIIGINDAIDGDAGTLFQERDRHLEFINDDDLTKGLGVSSGKSGNICLVGLLWDETLKTPLDRLEFTMNTQHEGGWFGANESGAYLGYHLDESYLIEPSVQITTDGGVSWTNVEVLSDYMRVFNGHWISMFERTSATATFILQEMVEGVNGVRLIGPAGGIGSNGGHIGIGELRAFAGSDLDPNLLVQRRNVFGNISPGIHSATLDITNNGAVQPVNIISASLTGPDADRFTLGPVPETVAAGETVGVTITLETGDRSGAFLAYLGLTTSDPNNSNIEVELLATIPTNNDLLAHYKLDETDGSRAFDTSGRGRHGKYITPRQSSLALGGPSLAGAGNAVRFRPSGSNVGYIEIPDTFPEFIDVSMSLWFKIDRVNNDTPFPLISKNLEGSQGAPFMVAITRGTVFVRTGVFGAYTIVASVPDITANAAHHLVVIFDQREDTMNAMIYLNGELAAEAPIRDFFDKEWPSSLFIGALNGEVGFEGMIDDVQIYGRAISSTDVTHLHANPNAELIGQTIDETERDSDSDGVSNANEAIAGTDPNDPRSVFRATQALRSAEGVALRWSSIAGKTYTVEYSPGLEAASWVAIGGVVGEGETAFFTDTDTVRTTDPKGFYRIRVE